MNRNLLEEFHNDPALLRRRLMAAAHRDRARAVGDAIAWLLGGIVRLLGDAKARFAPRIRVRPARWIERLG